MHIKKYPTCLGYSALIFWLLASPFVVKLNTLPLFEVLTISFSVSFFFTLGKVAVFKQWRQLKHSSFLWLVGFGGIYGNQIFFVSSFKYAPAAQVDLINYLWPIFVILFSGFIPGEPLKLRHILSVLLGFAGIYCLLYQGESFNTSYLWGYLLALIGAILWAVYTLIARQYSKAPSLMVGFYCGAGALCSLVLHFTLEETINPTSSEWLIMGLMGLTTQGVAYILWDFGVKHGNFRLLSLLSYGNPILSCLLLVALDIAKPSFQLFLAFLLVTLGGMCHLLPTVSWLKTRLIRLKLLKRLEGRE